MARRQQHPHHRRVTALAAASLSSDLPLAQLHQLQQTQKRHPSHSPLGLVAHHRRRPRHLHPPPQVRRPSHSPASALDRRPPLPHQRQLLLRLLLRQHLNPPHFLSMLRNPHSLSGLPRLAPPPTSQPRLRVDLHLEVVHRPQLQGRADPASLSVTRLRLLLDLLRRHSISARLLRLRPALDSPQARRRFNLALAVVQHLSHSGHLQAVQR